MSNKLRTLLNELLKKDDLLYYFTIIKKDQRDFRTFEIRGTIEKQGQLYWIYHEGKALLKTLEISEQNILYYAELAEQYNAHRLRSFKMPNLARLYLICYSYKRFLKLNDYLIASFIYRVNKYSKEADIYQKEEIYNEQLLDKDNRLLAGDILSLHINKKVSDGEIRSKSFAIVEKAKFQQFIQKIKKPHLNVDYYKWQYYAKNMKAIKYNVSPIFKVVEFQCISKDLLKAINFMQGYLAENHKYKFQDVPIAFIPKRLHRFVITNSKINGKKIKDIDLKCYEFMLYIYICKNIPKGVVTIRDSATYKSLDDELIPEDEMEANKDEIIEKLKTKMICDIDKVVAHFESFLDEKYLQINKRISDGSNDQITIKHNKKREIVGWHLPYKKKDEEVNNPFFETLEMIGIEQVIKIANDSTNFISKFTHILPKYSKTKPNSEVIAATLVAKGTGIDTHKMKDMCDVKESEILSVYHNLFRIKTLKDAANTIINVIAKMPIFCEYNLSDYGVHASVDGQKFETKYNIIKSRYSPKYFGLGKGVSAYTLFANHLPLCSKIIGTNEHESNYLFDIMNNNTSNVNISAVSGDMHSINRVNGFLLYMGYWRFMPRFVRMDEKNARELVCFDDPKSKKYDKCLIKPTRQVNKELIKKESGNIVRILATLGLKQNTQANIVRKLSSYKSNDTLNAMIELDKIIMSDYALSFIDDSNVRQVVHRSLNRIESYHQLRSSLAKIGGKKLIGKNELDISINNECSRLLALCIIFYNAYILSKMYEYCKSKDMKEACKQILGMSPIAWGHLNLIGKYEFLTGEKAPDLEKFTAKLLDNIEEILKGAKE